MDILDNWLEEKRSAYLYRRIALMETNPTYQKLFLNLATVAEKQAGIWATQLPQDMVANEYRPDWRAKLILSLVRCFGPRRSRLILAAAKVRGMAIYRDQNVVPAVLGTKEERHGNLQHTGNLRAAVFGVNDGLLSNASLMLGIAGANANPHFIVLSGVAGLLAGACSMGAGEYVSVRSQREMLEYQLILEKHELDTYPEEEAAELSFIYQARGLPAAEADRMAHLLIQNPDKALNTLAREELGINPDELGSPWGAAIASFTSFTVGAAVPLLPFVLMRSRFDLEIAIALTGISLFTVGASISLFTQRNAYLSGLRTLLIGLAAGGFTYFIGSLFGVSIQ